MKLQFIIVCDIAFTNDGRLNIIQTFDTVESQSFPTIYPKMSIVTKWEFEDDDDRASDHNQTLTITNTSSNQIIATIEKKLQARDLNDKSLQYITNVISMPFENPGTYEIGVKLDGKNEQKTIIYAQKET